MTREELLQTAKPILFNTEMVRAILDGRKTVTRRIWKDWNRYAAPDMSMYDADKRTYAVHTFEDPEHTKKTSIIERRCPICPGDILYVRETWHKYEKRVGKGEGCHIAEFYGYKASIANSEDANEPWKPSIHMPKEAARIWLKVKDVRVERLQDMDWQDALYEGIDMCLEQDMKTGEYIFPDENPLDDFIDLWDSTIKKSDLDRYGWDANPYVWVIEFERCEEPGKE